MATVQKDETKIQSTETTFGLLAIGSSGDWKIDVDESLIGAERWFMQIEGRTIDIHFEISSTEVINELARFLAPASAKTEQPSNGSSRFSKTLLLGGSESLPISLVKDDEFDDRFYIVVGQTERLTMRYVIAGSDVLAIADALRQVLEDLEAD